MLFSLGNTESYNKPQKKSTVSIRENNFIGTLIVMNLKDGKCIVPTSFQVNKNYIHALSCGICWMQNLSLTRAILACFVF